MVQKACFKSTNITPFIRPLPILTDQLLELLQARMLVSQTEWEWSVLLKNKPHSRPYRSSIPWVHPRMAYTKRHRPKGVPLSFHDFGSITGQAFHKLKHMKVLGNLSFSYFKGPLIKMFQTDSSRLQLYYFIYWALYKIDQKTIHS